MTMFALLNKTFENAQNPNAMDAVLHRLNMRNPRRRTVANDNPPQRRKILFESLEPRLLLSADLLPGAGQATQTDQQAADATYYQTTDTPQINWSSQGVTLDAPLYTSGMVNEFDLNNFSSPLAPVAPAGSLVYAGGVQGTLDFDLDSDTLQINLDGGQVFTLRFKPSNSDLQARVEAFDPNGNSLGFMEAANPGDNLILQVRAAANAGTYSIDVNSLAGAGDYTVEMFLNAAVEEGDTDFDNTQDLDNTFTALLDSGASRGAVVGELAGGLPVATLAEEDFQDGYAFWSDEGNGIWQLESYNDNGDAYIDLGNNGGYGDDYDAYLAMHADGNPTETWVDDGEEGYYVYTYDASLNQATWRVDLTGATRAVLSFEQWGFDPNGDGAEGEFYDSASFDGVAISVDGYRWIILESFYSDYDDGRNQYEIDLVAAAAEHGITLGADTRIRFQFYDGGESYEGYDGGEGGHYRNFDNIRITTDQQQILLTPDTVTSSGTQDSEYYNSLALLTDGNMPPEGTNWDDGRNVYWYGQEVGGYGGYGGEGDLSPTAGGIEGLYFDLDLGSVQRVADLVLSVDSNDDYAVDYSTDGENWTRLLDIQDWYGDAEWGMQSFSTWDESPEYQQELEFNPVMARYLRIYAAGGDGDYAIGEVQAYADALSDTEDWYRLTLEEGELASFTLSHENLAAGANMLLELYDADRNLVTIATAGSSQANKVIENFRAPAAGAYFLKVAGSISGEYNLVAVSEAQFGPAGAEDLTLTPIVLDALASSVDDEILVAVVNGNGYIQNQLNDDSYYDFNAVYVNASQVDSLAELNQYDAVVLGNYLGSSEIDAIAPALRQWVEQGHGLVTAGWVLYYATSYNNGYVNADLDAVVPINLYTSPSYNYGYPTVDIQNDGHPVTQGVGDFTSDYYYGYLVYGTSGVDAGADILAVYNGWPMIVANGVGNGRVVALSPDYDNSGYWYSANADRLLEQAVAWAAAPVNQYSVQALAGDTLTVSLDLIGADEGEPVNMLVPVLELYDSEGRLLVSGDFLVSHEVLADGQFTIKVKGAGVGDYLLCVSGNLPNVAQALEVTGSSLDGLPDHDENGIGEIQYFPGYVDISFSDPVLLTSLDNFDLTIHFDDGQGNTADTTASGFEILGPSTIRFFIGNTFSGDGQYNLTLAAGTVTDIHGNANAPWELAFKRDASGPVVVASNVTSGDTLEPGVQTFTFTFNEDLDPNYLDSWDAGLAENLTGWVVDPNTLSLSYDSGTRTVTLQTPELPDGEYTLTLYGGYYAFKDLLGNPLDGDGNGVNGDNFALNFSVDTQTLDYPAMEALPPLGSMVYDPVIDGLINAEGDVDTFDFHLDAGQTLTVIVDIARDTPELQIEIALFDINDPDNPVELDVVTGAVGEGLVLQNRRDLEGDYYVEVRGLQGTGHYTFALLLNAALEEEMLVGPFGNDSIETAQDLEDSSIEVGVGGSRMAVVGDRWANSGLGETVFFEDNGHYYEVVFVEDGLTWEDARAAAEARTYRGASGHLATITSVAENLFLTRVFGEGGLDGRYLGGYQTEDAEEPGGGWNWVTGEYFYGFANWGEGEPNDFGDEEYLQYAHGVDAEGMRWNDLGLTMDVQGYVVEYENANQAEDDYYHFHLDAGQAATIALAWIDEYPGDDVSLELVDGAGTVLALGAADANNASLTIRDFVAADGGDYYLRVSGDALGVYNLVVTRGIALGLPHISGDQAQAIDLTGQVLSHAGEQSIRVAVVDGSTIANQLNDDRYFNFTANSVSGYNWAYNVDLPMELAQYDVVVLGNVDRSYLNAMADELRQWVEGGGALVTTGWTVRNASAYSGTPGADLEAIVPVNQSGSASYAYYYPTLSITNNAHPVTDGVVNFSGGYYEYVTYPTGGIDAGALSLGSVNGYPSVVVGELGHGRTVALGPVYTYGGSWYSGEADQLLEQAVVWAANNRPGEYSFQANVDDSIEIILSMLGTGEGEPTNDLVPTLELIDPDGEVVELGGGGGLWTHTANMAGTYVVKVGAESGAGDYVLRVNGVDLGNRTLTVVDASIAEGQIFNVPPTHVDIAFSEALSMLGIEASDLTVNGQSALGVILLDTQTLRFDITGLVAADGAYTLELAEGAVNDLQNTGNAAFSRGFIFDLGMPTITATNVAEGEVLTPGAHAFTATFSEDMATAGLGAEDVLLVNTVTGQSFTPASVAYDAGTRTATASYANLPEGVYTLTLVSGANAFRDLVGNPLDGDPGSPGADNAVVHFYVDAEPAALAFTPILPAGSLIHQAEATGRVLHGTSDTDSFTVNLDAGQTLSFWALPTAGSAVMAIELFDAGDVPLGRVEATAAGQAVWLQTIAASGSGTYTLRVSSLAGAGQYTLKALLNAAAEVELVNGTGNDSQANAQNIDASFIATGSDRAAVVGQLHAASGLVSYKGHYYELVTTTAPWLTAKTAAEARSHLGASGHLATLETIEESRFIDSAFGTSINSAWIGGYQTGSYTEPSGGWTWVTGAPMAFTNWGSGEPNNSGGAENHVQFRSDSDSEGRLWNDAQNGSYLNYLVEYEPAAVGDWYSIHLDAGQKASVVLSPFAGAGAADMGLEIRDAMGNLLTAGSDVATNVDEIILDFNAPESGDYYLRVSGAASGLYSLVVTRDQTFGVSMPYGTTQDISVTGEVLGALGQGSGSGAAGQVAVVAASSGNNTGLQSLVNQINDHSYTSLNAVLVNVADVDTLAELNQYSAIIIGGTGFDSNQFSGFAANLRGYVEGGGGLLVTGWGIYASGGLSGQTDINFDAVVPVNTNGHNNFSLTTVTPVGSHPIVSGVGNFYTSAYIEYPATSPMVDAGATVLANVGSTPVAVAAGYGLGRSVYLGPVYSGGSSYNYSDLRIGEADQLLEQAVAWVAGNSVDEYLIQVNAGDELHITTSTPFDGEGAPANTLDARVELYDSNSGLTPVASNDDGAGDGRNADLTYVATTGGTYKIKVIAEAGSPSGEYVLRVTGATGTANAAPTVIASNPVEGKRLNVAPTSITLDISESVLATSLGVDDLSIDGGASVTGVEMIDGDTVRFLVDVPDVEGVYHYTLAADGLTDLQGEGNVAYTGSFVIDKTPPRVVSQSPEVQSISPFSTWTVTFSEAVDASTAQTGDFILTNPSGSTIGISSVVVSNDGLTATLNFSAQYTQGNYTLTVGPEIYDLAGNRMDQDAGTAGNQAYVGTVQVASPDLNPVSISVTLPDGNPLPEGGVALGSQVKVTWTVRNIGTDAARASAWYDSLWISPNTSSAGTNLANVYIDVDPNNTNGLAAGGEYTMSATVTLPLNDSFSAGTYYIRVYADDYGGSSHYQPENNENNNVLYSAGITTVVPPLPDLTVSDVTAPAVMEANKSYTVSWTVHNQGGAYADGQYGYWYDRVVLSTDQTFGNGDDVYLAEIYSYDDIAAGGQQTRSASVNIGSNRVGNWYVLVKADHYNYVYERTNEGNNVGASSAQVQVIIPTEDLTPIALSAPDVAQFDGYIDVSWTVRNAGTGPTYGNWYDRLWLSTDDTLGGDDIALNYVYASDTPDVRPLAAGSEYTRSLQGVHLPLSVSLPEGTYYLLLKTDTGGDEPELNENNNVIARQINLSLADYADLTVSDVTVPAEPVHSGDTVTVGFTLNNQGEGSAANFHNYVYLSSDGNSLDIYVGDYYFNQTLAASASATVEQVITIPLYNPGDWYVVVVSDAHGNIYEHANEGNNRATSAETIVAPLPPLPDLVVSNIIAPLDALAGSDITITWTITNQGEAVSGPWSDSLYLSFDGGVSNNIYLGNFYLEGTLAAGASVTRTQTFTLSPTLQGPRTVVVYTDAGSQVNETPAGQDNNRTVDNTTIDVTFPPLPNLQVTSLTPPSDPASGTETVVSWVVDNVGTGATSAAYWYDQVHLSLNTTWGDGDDIDMGIVINPNYLAAGESYQNSHTISIPKGLNGDYYFLVKTDVYNQVFEDQFEGDNVIVSNLIHIDLTPPPDLRVDAVEAQNLAFSGQPMTVSWTVSNHGDGRTVETGWYDRVVMSEDDVLGNADDRNMGDFWHVGALDPDESYSVTKNVTLPIGVVGDFYFFVITDRANHVYEHGSEFNNTGMDMLPDGTGPETTTIQLTPPPDLEVYSVTVPANSTNAPLAGHSYNVSWRVINYGATATPNNYWTDRIYLSTDNVLDGADVYLGERGHWGVLGLYEEDGEGNPVSGYYDASSSITLPFDISGDYRIIVKTDIYNNVFEGFDNPDAADGEDNNATASGVMKVKSRNADLVVDSFVAPVSGEAGKQIAVTWSVSNAGSGDSVANAWFDQIRISYDDVLGDEDDVVLQNFGRGGVLNAGSGYTRSETVTLPFSLDDGTYRLYVLADINNNVHESDNGNNSAFADIVIDRETPDLLVVSVTSEAEGMAALPLDVSWRVENQGENQTNVGTWYDDVYLSLDQVLDNSDIHLGYRYRNAPLAADGGYDASASFTLPANLAPNDYFVIVRTDRDNGVTEGALGEGNNISVSASQVHVVAFDPNNPDGVLPPELLRPDLTVTEVIAPDEAVSGQVMQVTWTVRNDGPDPTGNRDWYDAVYLSRDGVLDRNADIYLGHAYHTGLGVGATYTRTLDVTVPYGQSGPFYVFVATDAGRYITEADELDNVGQDAGFTQVALAPPADLVVGEIDIPVNGIPGQLATIEYSVENQGTNPALGGWFDSIYLSTDDSWDINDALFGVEYHYGTVAGGSSYTGSVTAALPGLTPGSYKVIIRSDIRNYIPESDETNNIGASLVGVALDVEELALGVADTGNLNWGQAVYYKFTVGEGETVRVKLDSLGTAIANELYVRFGAMPTRGQFDIAAREGFVSDPELVIPTSQAGTYYVLAYGQYAPGNPQYSITAQIIPFSITEVSAEEVGNVGDVTLRIQGARFDADTGFSLVAPDGTTIKARATFLENSSEAYVTFSLYGADVGQYDVVATQKNGASTTLADALSVVAGNDAAVFLSIAGPTQVMVNRTNIFTLDYVNDGGADAIAPLIILESLSATPMGLSASDLHTTPIHIMAASYDGPMDILRPGAKYSVPVVFQSSGVAGQLDIRAGRIMANDVRLIEDWDAIEASVRPSSIANEDWDAFWGRVKPLIGVTWGEYVQVLNHMMALVSGQGSPIRDVRDIFARMYLQNPDYVPYSSMSGEVRDSEGDTPLADIQMAAYLVHDDGHLEYKASAISDANGQFTFARLVPGEYTVVAIGRALDMDRDGQADLTTPDVTLGDTEPADAGVIYIQPVGGGVDDDSNPALTRDADGITHMVWNRDGQVWHSWFDAATGQWRDASAISTEQSYAPTIAANAKLLDGVNPGLLAAWQQGSGNDAEIWFAVGRAKVGGGFEWSAPVQLTDDDTADVSPEIIIGDTGVAMITHLKRNDAVQDDADIYYDLLGLSASDFIWPSASVASADTALATEGASVAYGAQWKFGPWDFFGTKAEIALALSGQVGENNCTASLGATGQLSGSFTGGSIRSTISGSGTVGAEWTVNEAARDWLFNRATAGWSAGAQFDWRYGLSTVLSKIPHPAVTAAYASYRTAVAIAGYLGLDFEDGITFGGSASFTGMEWKFTEPFPNFVWPESIAEASISGLIGVYAQLDAATGDSARLQGDLTVTVDIAPAVQLKSVTGNITLSGNIGWWTFNEVFTVNFYQASDVALLDAPVESQDTSGPVFNPDALIGTGNVYEGTALLGAGVSSDVTADSAVTLANDAGVIFGAWTHMADPFAGIGDEVMVSVFGSGWTTPVALTGSLGINADATAAVDSLGQRMVVWSHADSSGLGGNPSFDAFRAASDAADIVYAIYDEANGTWSSPVAVSSTLGRDGNIEVAHDAAGNLVMTWVVEGGDGGIDRLMSATWDGSAWSAAVEIATGASIGDPAIERLGDDIIVVWEENAAEEQGETENTLHYALYEEAAWSAGALFDPIAMMTGLALSAGDPSAIAAADAALTTESLFPPFPVPEECLKCKPEDIKRIRESAPECIPGGGTQVTFDPKTCTEKTIVYKPCVVRPRDPNDIIGPTGYGDDKWVAAKNTMGYMIRFENAADASAPAQQVVITQQLDDDLDWRTFRVDDFGFGDQIIELDGKSAFYQKRLDYTADPDRGYYLDVAVSVDVSTGIVTWTLTTIDPGTGEMPQDASIGFLPVNDTVYDEDHNVVTQGTGKGEGYVTYSVKAKRDVDSGTVVDAQARIVFDTEEPIDTPAIFNTLDAVVPESQIDAFAEATTSLTEFLVSWTGLDDESGSGVRDYTVYVSVDGGEFSIWQADTDLTEAIYIGAAGHTYSFYSTVRDWAGNEEAEPESADATITVTGAFGALSGVKFEDMDGDGARDDGEAGLAGWTLFLDADNDGALDEGESSTVSGEDGAYSFTDLTPGEYVVREVARAGWVQTQPGGDGSRAVTVVSDETAAGVDFGNFALAQIGGQKFNDLDADGVRDEGEDGLAGWTIQLDRNGDGGVEATATTDEYGYYRFTDLGPGSYRITEVGQAGWLATGAAAHTVATTSGADIGGMDFANVRAASIGGIKFEDVDGDGVRDEGEVGLAGWTIFLDADGNGSLDGGELYDVTDESGAYRFDDLLPGAYLVAEVMQDGWMQTSPGVGPSGTAHAMTLSGMDVVLSLPEDVLFEEGLTTQSVSANELADALTGLDAFLADARFDGFDGTGITTVVIDTGIDLNHSWFGPDADHNGVADRIVFSWDFADGDADAGDRNGHGSHVASLIGGQDATYGGVAQGADLIALKVFSDAGAGYFSYLEQALQWVVNNADAFEVGVVNLSLGDSGNWDTAIGRYGLGDELAALAGMNILVTAAAGNNYFSFGGDMGVAYPAADPAVLAVGAVWSGSFGGPVNYANGAVDYTTGADRLAAFGQRDGELLDVLAPGTRLVGANYNGGTRTMFGTSQASAYMAGIATLAQDIALDHLGRRLSLGEFTTLLADTSVWVNDGDDENDNVDNTGLDFARVDMLALAEGILAMESGGSEGEGGGTTDDGEVHPLAAPGVHHIALAAGEDHVDVNFGNFALGSISGNVFEDLNADGGQALTDVGADGWTVFLDADGDAELDVGEHSTISDADGDYRFDDLGPGSYRVTLMGRDGWIASTDSFFDVFMTSGLDADADFGVNATPVLTLTGPASVTDDQDYVLGLSASDLDLNTVGNWLVNWGDGSSGNLAAAAGNLAHRYALPGDYTVNVTATDEAGAHAATASVKVVAGTLKVTDVQTTATGFKVKFNRAYVPELLNLYDSSFYNRGAADLKLKDSIGRSVAGSMVLDGDHMGLTFVKTNGLLSNGNYSLTLESRANGFADSLGGLLDGNRDGVAGDNYVKQFTVSGSGAVLSLGEFTRGPGQMADLPATSAGVPVTITGATGARQVAFTLAYDASLLSITGVSVGAGIPAGSSASADFSVAGQVTVTVQINGALTAAATELVRFAANVPATAPYGAKQVLDLKNILLDTGAAVRDDDGLHLAAYVGDASGNAKYSTLDVQRIQRAVVKLDSGFGAYPMVDPVVVADVNGNFALTALDAQRMLSKVMGIDRPEIPAIPKGMTLTFSGPDPLVTVSSVEAKPGETVVVPVNLDTAAGLESVELALAYSAENLELLNVRVGGLVQDFEYVVKDTSVPGRVSIDMSRLNALLDGSGALLELEFKVSANAKADLAIDLQYAALNETWLTLGSVPQVGADPTDGVIKVKLPPPPVEVRRPAVNFATWASDFTLGHSAQNGWVNQWLNGNQEKTVARKLNNWKLSLPKAGAKP
jgi:subtilase family serine protease